MALNKNKDLKMFYSISEVAQMFNVTETLLRFWEKEFPNISHRRRVVASVSTPKPTWNRFASSIT